MKLKQISPILQTLINNNITPIVVGGFVRDHIMGNSNSKDIDIELYNLSSLDGLISVLEPFGSPLLVGKSFGVIKLLYNGYDIDFSLPRTESKVACGHRGFSVTTHSNIDYKIAATRRDFTINSIGYNTITGQFLDPFNGITDIKNRVLRVVNNETFIEDPLRILRAMSFGARFEFSYSDELITLCKKMVSKDALSELAKERIYEEFKKLFLLSKKPSIGLGFLDNIDALKFFSPLDKLKTTLQNNTSHPEGSVWIHTLMAIDYITTLYSDNERKNLIYAFAILLHDIGKIKTTVIIDGEIKAPNHADVSVELADVWLDKLTDDKALRDEILTLIKHHGSVKKIYNASDYDILKLSTKIVINDLLMISKADFYGRAKDINRVFNEYEWLENRAKNLGVLYNAPKPLIMGRDLVALKLTPSPTFKIILDDCYDAQLRGYFDNREDGILYLKNHLSDEIF